MSLPSHQRVKQYYTRNLRTAFVTFRFGAGFMGETTGIIYNNHMADFAMGNSTDIYGLPQNQHNRIEPGESEYE
jgi:gamma-glutamyltranspeptidase